MRLYEVACILVFVVGGVLFLYGANYYDAVVGWVGVALFVGAFFAGVIFKTFEFLNKRK